MSRGEFIDKFNAPYYEKSNEENVISETFDQRAELVRIGVSSIPWVSFTTLTHTISLKKG
jgi:hypothetical protein